MENGRERRTKASGNHFNWLGAFSTSSLRQELTVTSERLEHRAEVLLSLFHQYQASGSHELAESCKRQAAEFQKQAQSIRKILDLKERRE